MPYWVEASHNEAVQSSLSSPSLPLAAARQEGNLQQEAAEANQENLFTNFILVFSLSCRKFIFSRFPFPSLGEILLLPEKFLKKVRKMCILQKIVALLTVYIHRKVNIRQIYQLPMIYGNHAFQN
jgi:hypothetical protein